MTSQEKLWPWQSLPGYQQKASEYAAAQPPHQEPLHPQPAASEDKPNHADGPAIAVAEQSVTSNNNALKNQYIPTAIRTPCIFAFCLVVLVVFILLEYAAATHIQDSGSGQKASQYAKRIAYPQVPTISTTASSTTSSATPSPSDISTAPPPGSWSSTDGNYFLGAYVPTLIAIWLSIWWKCIFARLKETEPFYQLKKSGGAKAEDSLLLSYADSRLPTVLLNAWRARHWRTFAGAVNLVLITLCTLFASETLSLQAVGDKCGVIVDAIGSQNDGCHTELKMRPVLGFVLGAMCFIIAVVALWVKMKLSLRRSGIFAEATSIAGIACLANAELCQETTQSIQRPERRFTLAYKNTGTTNSIVEITPDVSRSHPPILEEISECPRSTPSDTPLELKTVPLLAFLLFQIGIVFLILYYRFVSKPGTNNALENFMDSDSFGVHLFMSLVGLSVKICWSCIESRLRRLLPYVALASPNGAPAEKSVLLKTASHPLMALLSRNTWKLPLLGLVSLIASLSEVLVITLNAVPFTTATAYTAFEVSVYLSTCILVLMIATILLILGWKIRTKHADLPEIPRCMFDVLGLVGDGQDWKALGLLYEKERNQEIAMWKCNFSVKKFNQKWQIVAMRL